MTKLIALVIAGVLSWAVAGHAMTINSNYGGGGGGYPQLPTCGSMYWGTTLYVQGFYWYCPVGGNHWIIV